MTKRTQLEWSPPHHPTTGRDTIRTLLFQDPQNPNKSISHLDPLENYSDEFSPTNLISPLLGPYRPPNIIKRDPKSIKKEYWEKIFKIDPKSLKKISSKNDVNDPKTLSNRNRTDIEEEESRKCRNHPKKFQEFFCLEKGCMRLICSDCALFGAHKVLEFGLFVLGA